MQGDQVGIVRADGGRIRGAHEDEEVVSVDDHVAAVVGLADVVRGGDESGEAPVEGVAGEVQGEPVARIADIQADPGAVGFYERMGAERTGQAPSASIPGRVLPVLAFSLRPAD